MRIVPALLVLLAVSICVRGQDSNPSVRPRTASPAQSPSPATDTVKPATGKTASQTQTPSPVNAPQTPGSAAVIAAFERLLNGIRNADVKLVTSVYWNSPQLVLFNNNGTVTKGWEQLRKNRESSYPKLADVKLAVRDVSVIMLGRDGAVVSCFWNQTQTNDGVPESASGRMSLVFRRSGAEWKAVHLHTSPDKEDPPGETPSPSPTPSPEQ